MTDPLFFALAAGAILVIPGPTNALLFASGAIVGFWRSIPLILAEIIGYLAAIGAMTMVGGAAISAVPLLGLTLRVTLIGYLFAMAWRLWRSGLLPARQNGRRITFRQITVATVLNPKALILSFAVFPPMEGLSFAAQYGLAFSVIAAGAASCWIGFGLFVSRVGEGRIIGIIPRATAVVLCIFASMMTASAVLDGPESWTRTIKAVTTVE